jgi:hypothetical protein
VNSWLELLAHEALPLGVVGASDLPGPIHTLRHPILSDSAARAFFAGGRVPLARLPTEAANQAAIRNSLLRRELAGSEPSEAILEELTRHTCAMQQPTECAALLGRWTASHPDSPKLAQAAREIRSRDAFGATSNVLTEETIGSLVELYRGHPLTAPEVPGPVRNALATSNYYISYFHHAFPFDRTAVQKAWSACEADQRTAVSCTAERRKAEKTLGPIYPRQAGVMRGGARPRS